MLCKKKLVSDGEKLVSDFEQFSFTHPHTIHTQYLGYMSVDNCKTINIFQQITALRSRVWRLLSR